MATTRNRRGERELAAWKAEVLERCGKMEAMKPTEPILLSVHYVNADGLSRAMSRHTFELSRSETADDVQFAIDSGELKFQTTFGDEFPPPPHVDYQFVTVFALPPSLPSFIRHGARWEIRHTFYHPKSLKTYTQGRDGFRDEWATPTARAIAAGIVESGDWSRLVILADAIQDAGCEDAALLGLMRLAGVLGLDMGGWWLMERLCPPERLPQYATTDWASAIKRMQHQGFAS